MLRNEVKKSFERISYKKPTNIDQYMSIYGNGQYVQNEALWPDFVQRLDECVLSLYHTSDLATQEIVQQLIADLMTRFTVPFNEFPWATSHSNIWYVRLPSLFNHALFLPCQFTDGVIDLINAYQQFITDGSDASTLVLPFPKKGRIIGTGFMALESFFNWWNWQVLRLTAAGDSSAPDTSGMDLTSVSANLSIVPRRLMSKASVIVPKEGLQNTPAKNCQYQGNYHDYSIIDEFNMFNVKSLLNIFPYVSLYRLIDPNLDISYLERVFRTIFHSELLQGPYFCVGNTATQLYNNSIHHYFPNVKNNYGIDVIPFTGSVFIKTPKSYFAVRVQNQYLPAFRIENDGSNDVHWPLAIMARQILCKGYQYPNHSNEFEVATTPGVISNMDSKIDSLSPNSYGTGISVDQIQNSFVFKLPDAPNSVAWGQDYRIPPSFFDSSSGGDGVLVSELGIAAVTDGVLDILIRYTIENRRPDGHSLQFFYRDLYNPKLVSRLYDANRRPYPLKTVPILVIHSNTSLTFYMYQSDIGTSNLLSNIRAGDHPIILKPDNTGGKMIEELGEGGGAISTYVAQNTPISGINLFKLHKSTIDTQDNVQFSICYKTHQYVVRRLKDTSGAGIYSINQDSILITCYPDMPQHLQYNSNIYPRDLHYNYRVSDTRYSKKMDDCPWYQKSMVLYWFCIVSIIFVLSVLFYTLVNVILKHMKKYRGYKKSVKDDIGQGLTGKDIRMQIQNN